jgi:two-component system, chemotaxis family, chemotaxis protein CheY
VSQKVLVVDDSETVRRHVVQSLESADFEVLTACDGPSGIALLKINHDLCLVILDLNMPGMGGLSVLDWMRAEGSPHLPPAVIMTTETTPRDMDRAKRGGAWGWLIKPVTSSHLVAVAKRVVENREPSAD